MRDNVCDIFRRLDANNLGVWKRLLLRPGLGRRSRISRSDVLGSRIRRESLSYQHRRTAPRLVPQREFDAVPKSKFVVNYPQVILHDMLRRPDGVSYLFVL